MPSFPSCDMFRWARVRDRGRRFARAQDGAVAIEFGFVAFPFIAIMFALIEVCMVFFAGQLLEKGTQDTARLILTGKAQQAGMTDTEFKQKICGEVTALLDCTKLSVDVKSYPSFAAVDVQPPISNGELNITPTFQPGGPGDIIIVRVFYPWQMFVPTMGLNLSNINNNKRLLSATAVFRNEPYSVSAPAPPPPPPSP